MNKIFAQIVQIACLCFVFHATTQASPQALDDSLRQKLIAAINDNRSFKDKYAAEVWLTDMSLRMQRYVKHKDDRIKILTILHEEATRVNVAPELVLAVIQIESAFNRYAISYVGARGLMQVMPFWLKEIGKPDENLFDIRTNLRMGCTILRHYLDREKNDKRKALARYNGSVGKRKYPDKIFNALSRNWYRQ